MCLFFIELVARSPLTNNAPVRNIQVLYQKSRCSNIVFFVSIFYVCLVLDIRRLSIRRLRNSYRSLWVS